MHSNQRSNCQHLFDHSKGKRITEKHLLLLYWLFQSLWVDYNKLWRILKEMGIPDHLTCLLRSLYAGQEAIVRTRHGTADWFQTGKRVCQGCILLPCLFNLYAEYIMRNAGLDEAQAGIKIARRNIKWCHSCPQSIPESHCDRPQRWPPIFTTPWKHVFVYNVAVTPTPSPSNSGLVHVT